MVQKFECFNLVHLISSLHFKSTDVIADFRIQKKRDEHCNVVIDANACDGKYRARIGMLDDEGRRWACFCEDNLSEDMNFNHGSGDYDKRFSLVAIN